MITVLDRRQPIARIVPLDDPASELVIRPARGSLHEVPVPPPVGGGSDVVEQRMREREERPASLVGPDSPSSCESRASNGVGRMVMVGGLWIAATATPTADASYVPTDLCKSTNLIVVGTADFRESFVSQEKGRQKVYTDVSLHVERVIRGQPATSLELRVRGGEVDGLGQVAAGEPSLRIGERHILFMWQGEDDQHPIFVYHGNLPSELVLPQEHVLRDFWSSLCRSNPGGVFSDKVDSLWLLRGSPEPAAGPSSAEPGSRTSAMSDR